AQDVQHLLELEFARRGLGNGVAFEPEARARTLEIETVGKLAVGLVDRVGQFVLVDFGDDVERRHVVVLVLEVLQWTKESAPSITPPPAGGRRRKARTARTT